MSAPGDQRTKVWYLRRINLFASMTDEEIEELARLLDDHHIPAGTELLHDRRRERVYIVKTGAVRLYAGEPPREVTLALLGPGRLFGLSASAGDDSPAVGAVTLEPSFICFTSWPKILEVLALHPGVMRQIVGALAQQVFLTESWIERRHLLAPGARLASLLLELVDEFGEPAGADGVRRLRFRLTQVDLARMVGLSRETTSRLLTEFRRAGWVTREQGLMVVRDRQSLVTQAGRGAER